MATNRIGVGVLAAGLSAAQAALTLAQAERPAKLGQGSHTYEWVSGWLKLPPGMNVGQTHGDVVVDSEDRVYFSVDSGNAIFQTDTEGHVARVFGQALGGGVHGMRLVKEPGGREVIWIAHLSRHEVLKISLDGQILMTIPFPDKGGMYRDANEYVPTAVDVSPNGDVYVADGYGRYWVHRFNAKGEYVQSWNGTKGAGPFREPHGIGIDLRDVEPRVVVADRRNHRLQRFTLDGQYVDTVGKDLRLPSKVVTRGRDLLVVDLDGRVTVFDQKYEVLAQLGDNTNLELRGKYAVPPSDWKAGEFIAPHGAAWDSKGDMYVADWNAFGRINKLKRERK